MGRKTISVGWDCARLITNALDLLILLETSQSYYRRDNLPNFHPATRFLKIFPRHFPDYFDLITSS
jgi:hypothetical protein